MNLTELHKYLRKHTAKQVFPDGKVDELYRKYARICHPDGHDGDDLAKETFALLGQRKRELTAGIVITSKKGSYEVEREPRFNGDLADFYVTKDAKHLLKIARNDKHKTLMQNEKEILSAVRPGDDSKMRFYFPELINSFTIGQKNYPNRQCHVFKKSSDSWVTLAKIKETNRELDPRHLGWIFKRMLVALTVTHRAGYVHGAVVPQHVLVNKDTHGGRLVGWCHAKKIGEKIKFIPKGSKKFYPKEILDKEPATPATDIYMAAACMVHLAYGHIPSKMLPGEFPKKLSNFFRALMVDHKARPDDAWELHKSYDDLLRVVFGKPQFVTLTTGD